MPGSTHRSWNKEWPVLRILMRHECNPALAHRGDPAAFQELLDCTAALHAQHAQLAVQQYMQYQQYAVAAQAAGEPPYSPSHPQPWGYSGPFGWPG